MNKLIPSFKDVIFNDESNDVIKECVEIGIDSILDNELLKTIPLVNVVFSIAKVGQNIHDRNLIKQLIAFINAFNSGNISPDKLSKYKEELENNPKKSEEELGRVIVILNSTIDDKKSKILGTLYRAYVNEAINWNQFCELSEITRRLFVEDLKFLKSFYPTSNYNYSEEDEYKINRLESIGLLSSNNHWNNNVLNISRSTSNKLTGLGRLFCGLVES